MSNNLTPAAVAAISAYIDRQGGAKLLPLLKDTTLAAFNLTEEDIFVTEGDAVSLQPQLLGIIDFVAYTVPPKEGKEPKRRFFLVPAGTELETSGGEDEDDLDATEQVLDGNVSGVVIDETLVDRYFVVSGTDIKPASSIDEACALLFSQRAAGNITSVFGGIPLELEYQARLQPVVPVEVEQPDEADESEEG